MELCRILPASVADGQSRADEMGVLRNSFMAGAGSQVGFTGERALVEVLKATGVAAIIADKYDFDVLANGRVKLELKTKRTTAPPQPYYDNSVSNFNVRQSADFYVFLRIQWDEGGPAQGGTLWFCGFMACEEYKKRARFLRKGQRDGNNGYVCRSNCYNLPIKDCGTWAQLYGIMSQTPVQDAAIVLGAAAGPQHDVAATNDDAADDAADGVAADGVAAAAGVSVATEAAH